MPLLDEETSIDLSSIRHAAYLQFDPAKQCWIYVDTNDFARFKDNPDYYRELDTDTLVESIFISFGNKTFEHVILGTQILSENPTQQQIEGFEAIDKKYKLSKEQVSIKDGHGVSLLHRAVQSGDVEQVNKILQLDATLINDFYYRLSFDKNDKNKHFFQKVTPIYAAVVAGDKKMVSALLAKGANPNVLSYERVTPLYNVVQKGDVDLINILLANGADPNIPDDKGVTPLYIAARDGNLKVVNALLARGALINTPGMGKATPLYTAIKNGHSTLAKFLLEKGANVDAPDVNGISPLHVACICGNAEMVRALLEKGAAISKHVSSGWTPLHLAAQQGEVNVVKVLLEKGVGINTPGAEGAMPIHFAAERGHLAVVKLLVEHGADLSPLSGSTAYADGCTPLHLAAQNGHLEVVKFFLANGADINSPLFDNSVDFDGLTPLHLAAQSGHVGVVKFLVEQGAEINSFFDGGWTPFQLAVAGKHVAVVRFLLEKGADVNRPNPEGTTPLQLAVTSGDVNMITALLDHGADANSFVKGVTKDKLVSQYGSPIAELLLKGKAATLPIITAPTQLTNATPKEGKSLLVARIKALFDESDYSWHGFFKGCDPKQRTEALNALVNLIEGTSGKNIEEHLPVLRQGKLGVQLKLIAKSLGFADTVNDLIHFFEKVNKPGATDSPSPASLSPAD